MTQQYIRKLNDHSKYVGKLVQLLDREFEKRDGDETSRFIYEVARRPPGVRLIIVQNKQILLTREFRSELEDWDYRIPGGKIFENIESYLPYVDNEHYILTKSIDTAINEGREEAGINLRNPKLFHLSRNGSAMEWNLYYYLVEDFDIRYSNEPEAEEIIHPEWFSFKDAFQMCINGRIQEDRSVGVLLRYFSSDHISYSTG